VTQTEYEAKLAQRKANAAREAATLKATAKRSTEP